MSAPMMPIAHELLAQPIHAPSPARLRAVVSHCRPDESLGDSLSIACVLRCDGVCPVFRCVLVPCDLLAHGPNIIM